MEALSKGSIAGMTLYLTIVPTTLHFIYICLQVQYLLRYITKYNHHKILTTNTRCAWAGGTFFPVVLLCQFLILAGNRSWFYILTYLEYNTVVALC
jgi:hypothetical protein